MTLPASGSISTAQIQAEVGDAGSITIPDANTRTLTGKSTGAIILPTDFYGKTFGGGGGGTTYIPVAGSYSDGDFDTISYSVTASVSVAWTWSASGTTTGLSSNRTSGSSGTSIIFTYTPTMASNVQSRTCTITLSSGGNTWTITLTATNSNYVAPGTTYNPVGGTYSAQDWDSVGYTITASASAVWTWSASATTGLTSTRTSGSSGTSIVFTYSPPMSTNVSSKSTVITLSSGGSSWSITLITDNSSFDSGGSQMTL